jgi:hypothetical protein
VRGSPESYFVLVQGTPHKMSKGKIQMSKVNFNS